MPRQSKFCCLECHEQCKDDCIQCSECEDWAHRVCIPMSKDLFSRWSKNKRPRLTFLCRRCAFRGNEYDFVGALLRLRKKVPSFESEVLLLETYQIELPPSTGQDQPGVEDTVSASILQMLQPAALAEFSPRAVMADGNCMYRSLSLAVFGTEEYHSHLRLLTALEIYQHRSFYDYDHPEYVDLLKDDRIHRSNFRQLIRSTITLGRYAGMQHILAASAVLKAGISSYYPPTVVNSYMVAAYSTSVFGRDVRRSKGTTCTLMWTQTLKPETARGFKANHFSVLSPRIADTQGHVVDLTDQASPVSSFADFLKSKQESMHSPSSSHSWTVSEETFTAGVVDLVSSRIMSDCEDSSVIDDGDTQMTTSFDDHLVTHNSNTNSTGDVITHTWSLWCTREQKRHFRIFTRTVKPVSSTDGARIGVAPTGGKKPGQVKRKRCAKTLTMKKQRK